MNVKAEMSGAVASDIVQVENWLGAALLSGLLWGIAVTLFVRL